MEDKWNDFLKTGKIEDYLKYKMGNIKNEISENDWDSNKRS